VGAVLKNGDQVVTNSGDRVVVETPRGFTVYKDDDALLRQAGSNVRTETFNDGSTRTILDRNDGTQVITIRDSRGRVLRRARVFADGTQVELFDDIAPVPAVDVRRLESIRPTTRNISVADANRAALRDALYDELAFDAGRSFSLRQIREIEQVRSLMPAIDLDLITFESGSAAIPTDQVRSLVRVGLLMEEILSENPREVFLIEGHTDATGSASFNLVLSDRRAESVALALTENFRIPPENLVVQGYGEEFLKINTQLSEGRNRRATVRRITPLLRQVASN
jgi:outer membrane protein OmpA-like peptidoglycan-associated protein